jgi:hypothetical protein
LGELTRNVPFSLVDEVLEHTGRRERRVRLLPARVMVYLLLAAGLFESMGWTLVWAKVCAGLVCVPDPTGSALRYARKRLGAEPMRALFGRLCGPATGSARWRNLLVCAVDGTTVDLPDSPANRRHYGIRGTGDNQAGYPQARLLCLLVCGSRSLLGAVFGTTAVGEPAWTKRLLRLMAPGQLILFDRGFASGTLMAQVAGTGADFLIRITATWKPVTVRRLPDGSRLVAVAGLRLRLIEAEITIATSQGANTSRYRLLTTLCDPDRYPAFELIELYHQRWEIETAYAELKSTLLRRRVLRSGDPAGIAQELFALLCLYQVIRTAIATAVTGSGLTPLQASFKRAVETARNQLIRAACICEDTALTASGKLSEDLTAHPIPDRGWRTAPRVVKRAISKHRAKGQVNRHTYKATLKIALIDTR